MTQEARREGAVRATAAPSRCSGCGQAFQCGIDDPAGCWCATLPALPRDAYEADAACLCERCLRALLAADRASAGERA
jgi:hypothetical protein